MSCQFAMYAVLYENTIPKSVINYRVCELWARHMNGNAFIRSDCILATPSDYCNSKSASSETRIRFGDSLIILIIILWHRIKIGLFFFFGLIFHGFFTAYLFCQIVNAITLKILLFIFSPLYPPACRVITPIYRLCLLIDSLVNAFMNRLNHLMPRVLGMAVSSSSMNYDYNLL